MEIHTRLINLLNEKALTPKELILKVKADVDKFSEGAGQFDDITMISVKFITF